MEHKIQWKITQLIVIKAISWTWDKNDKIQVNMEEVAKLWFPEWSVFAWNLDLQKGVPYNDREIS